MKKILVAAAVACLILIFAFYRTMPEAKKTSYMAIKQDNQTLLSSAQIEQLAHCQPFILRQTLSINDRPVDFLLEVKGYEAEKCLYNITVNNELFAENIKCAFSEQTLKIYTEYLKNMRHNNSVIPFVQRSCHHEYHLHDLTSSFRQALTECHPEVSEIRVFNGMYVRQVYGFKDGGCEVSYAQYRIPDVSYYPYGRIKSLGFRCTLDEKQRLRYLDILEKQLGRNASQEKPFVTVDLEDEVNFFIDTCKQAEHLDVIP